MAASSLFEVRFKLRPTVREIQRSEQAAEPTVTAVRKTGRYPRAAQVLALALQFQEMIDWLAPDIQQAVLRLPPSGRAPFSEGALRRIAKKPLWEDQRRASRALFG